MAVFLLPFRGDGVGMTFLQQQHPVAHLQLCKYLQSTSLYDGDAEQQDNTDNSGLLNTCRYSISLIETILWWHTVWINIPMLVVPNTELVLTVSAASSPQHPSSIPAVVKVKEPYVCTPAQVCVHHLTPHIATCCLSPLNTYWPSRCTCGLLMLLMLGCWCWDLWHVAFLDVPVQYQFLHPDSQFPVYTVKLLLYNHS